MRSSPATATASFGVRTLWSSATPASQIGYQSRSATSAKSRRALVHEHEVEVARRRELPSPERAAADDRDAGLVAEQAPDPLVDELAVRGREVRTAAVAVDQLGAS